MHLETGRIEQFNDGVPLELLPNRVGGLFATPEPDDPEPVHVDTDAPMVPVRPCAATGARRVTHVVDEDAPDATVCGEEVVWAGRLSSKRETCPACHRGVVERVEAGEWTAPVAPEGAGDDR